MATVWISVDRSLVDDDWAEVELLARKILEGEKKCSVCGSQDIPVHLTIDGGSLREGRFVVGLLECSGHGSKYVPKDYRTVNGLLLLGQSPTSGQEKVCFDLPWKDFEKTIAAITSYDPAFVGGGLRSYFSRGYGHLCWKFLEFPEQQVSDWYRRWGIQSLPSRVADNTPTFENKYHHHFVVPAEAYSMEKYRQELNSARTLDEVERILHDYYRYRRKP